MARIVRIDARHPDLELLAEACLPLAAGDVVGMPTDTLYGLGANALEAAAVERVFAVKRRSARQAMPVVVRDASQAEELAANLPALFWKLAATFWPGPLSLIVAAGPRVPQALHAGTERIAVRQPDCPLLLRLLERLDFPLTATSANQSGEPAARTAAEVAASFGDALALIIDGGPAPQTLPSTMVDLTGLRPRLLRAGAIAVDRLTPWCGIDGLDVPNH